MDRLLRRVRGALLRVALARRAAVVTGSVLALAAACLMVGEFTWENWATDGLALIFGGTGAALVLAGLGGRRADWVNPDESDDSRS